MLKLSVSATHSLNIYWGRQEEPAILVSSLLLRMRRMYVQNAIWSRAFRPSVSRNLITRGLTIFQKLRNSQRCSKSVCTADHCRPHSLWLLLVPSTNQSYPLDFISCNCHPEHWNRKRNRIQKGKDITEQWWAGSNGRSKKIPILLSGFSPPFP